MSVYGDRAYRAKTKALKDQCRKNNTPCWICKRPFDFDLPYTEPMSWTADHLQALANGGKLHGELRPAHRACNSRRGAGSNPRTIGRPSNSIDW